MSHLSKIFIFCAFTIFAVLSVSESVSHNKVVVVPLSGDDFSPLANIITVAKENGDFSDPVMALASISDSSESNPYIVVIAPGVYTLTQTMIIPQGVTVVGSGRWATTIKASLGNNFIGRDAAVVAGTGAGRSLSDMTIINSGGSGQQFSIGIYVSGNPLALSRLYVEASGSQNNIGILISGNTEPMNDVQIKAFGGSYNWALDLYSDQIINNVQAHASGGSSNNYGVELRGGSAQINNLTAVGVGPGGYGVYASGFGPSSRIDNSILKGDTKAIRINGVGMRIVSTEVDGGITDDFGGSAQCLDVYTPSLVFQSC